MSDLWPLVILGIVAVEALSGPIQKIVLAFRIGHLRESETGIQQSADFAAMVLRSCADDIRKKQLNWAVSSQMLDIAAKNLQQEERTK